MALRTLLVRCTHARWRGHSRAAELRQAEATLGMPLSHRRLGFDADVVKGLACIREYVRDRWKGRTCGSPARRRGHARESLVRAAVGQRRRARTRLRSFARRASSSRSAAPVPSHLTSEYACVATERFEPRLT